MKRVRSIVTFVLKCFYITLVDLAWISFTIFVLGQLTPIKISIRYTFAILIILINIRAFYKVQELLEEIF